MRKLLLTLMLCMFSGGIALAEQVPVGIQDFVNKSFPNTNFRFDGVVILPDNTMYLPIFLLKFKMLTKLE